MISHQIGLGLHEGRELLEAAAQLLQNLLVKHLTDTTQHPARQGTHEERSGEWGGLRQQAIAQHRILAAACADHPRSSRQGGVGPVLQQQHLGPLGGMLGQRRIGMLSRCNAMAVESAITSLPSTRTGTCRWPESR